MDKKTIKEIQLLIENNDVIRLIMSVVNDHERRFEELENYLYDTNDKTTDITYIS